MSVNPPLASQLDHINSIEKAALVQADPAAAGRASARRAIFIIQIRGSAEAVSFTEKQLGRAGNALSGTGHFIAGDWGTSNLRLFLCDARGNVLEQADGPGAAGANSQFAALFASLTSNWRETHGSLQAVLCGMVGSTFGWTLAPYVPCPAIPQQVAEACVSLPDHSVSIIPGLSCHNRYGAPDFMRGEETQIMGALALHPTIQEGRSVVCLPGTHTKWVVLEDGSVTDFFTVPTGEIFAVLREHSVLVRSRSSGTAQIDLSAFEQGVTRFHEFPHAQLLHRLFEARSRQLSRELTPDAAAAFLSGLLIASDVHGARVALPGTGTIHLVGAPQLCQLYSAACARSGWQTVLVDGTAASLSGLVQVHRRLIR